MFKYVVVMEAIITLLYGIEIFTTQMGDLFRFIIVILLYLCLKLVYYIFHKTKSAKYILMGLNIGIVFVAYTVFFPLLYFLVLNMTQLIKGYTEKYRFVFLLLLSVIFVVPNVYIEKLYMISLFSAIFIFCTYNLDTKINTLKNRNEKLKKLVEKMQEDNVLAKQYDANVRYQYQLEQRNILAQTLHDELGHTLSGNTIQLEAAKVLIERDAQKSKALIQEVISNLRQGMESIRVILKNTKPENATININNIKLLASDVEAKSKINISIIYNNDIAVINPKKWAIITKNIREALTNLMKYSKATKCKIIFERLNKLYKVTVIDNGQGCIKIRKSLGIKGMEERMSATGGQLIIDGSNGFTLVMLFPLDGEDERR